MTDLPAPPDADGNPAETTLPAPPGTQRPGGDHLGSGSQQAAERIALALVNGQVPADLVPLAREGLRMHLRALEVQRAAAALTAYRAGENVWSWPATAPWAGFGDGKR